MVSNSLVLEDVLDVLVGKADAIGSAQSGQDEVDEIGAWFHLVDSPEEPLTIDSTH